MVYNLNSMPLFGPNIGCVYAKLCTFAKGEISMYSKSVDLVVDYLRFHNQDMDQVLKIKVTSTYQPLHVHHLNPPN